MTAVVNVGLAQAAGPTPSPGPAPVTAGPENDCICKCNVGDDTLKARYDAWDEQYRAAGGRGDDLLCAPEVGVMVCTCAIGQASAPGMTQADINQNLSLSSSPLPNVSDNLLPWALVQEGGAQPRDFTQETMR